VDSPVERVDPAERRSITLLDDPVNHPGELEQAHAEEVQALFLAHTSQIRGFIGALVPDSHRAQDIFQDVFLTMQRRAAQFEHGTNFLAWIRAIARNKILQERHLQIRRDRTYLPLDITLLDRLEEELPALEQGWEDRKAALAQCLEAVPARARQIVDLRFQENLLPAEIAERISWTVNAVRVALTRVRRMLFQCVEKKVVPRVV
jgi:RNA polymerase sigma-70 factor (ECF subfamily)